MPLCEDECSDLVDDDRLTSQHVLEVDAVGIGAIQTHQRHDVDSTSARCGDHLVADVLLRSLTRVVAGHTERHVMP